MSVREGGGFARQEAREWIDLFLTRQAALVDFLQDRREQYGELLRDALTSRTTQQRKQRLQSLSLRDVAGGDGILLRPLEEHGVTTVGDFLRFTREELLNLHGVGPATVNALIDRIRRRASLQAGDVVPPADPASWSRTDASLAGAVERWSAMTAALDEPDLAELLALIRRIRRLQWRTSSLWWLLCGRALRERTQEDYRLAVNTAAAPHLHRLLDSLEAVARQEAAVIEAGGLSRDEVEQRWRKSSARLLAGLDHFIRLHGTSEEREGLQARLSGSLDADLLRRLNDFPLDDSLLNPSRPLRGYQIIAARFALVVGRGLLGDDMGLGKTVEAIAAIAHAMAAEGQTHHIVVCPAVLIDNWLREITVATRGVAAHAHREPGRDDAYRAWLHKGGGILLVSYSQAHLLAERIAGDRPAIGFLIADEAHRAKHPGARQSRATRELAERAQRVLLMSGTLMENRAEEIIRLTELARPDSGRALRQRFGNDQDAYHRHMEFRETLSLFHPRAV